MTDAVQEREPTVLAATPTIPTVGYISGIGRCGSTLLSFLLNTHPAITAIGEMHAPPFPRDRPDERMCSCGVPIMSCPFFCEIAEKMEAQGIAFDPRTWDLTYSLHGRPRLGRLVFGSLRNSFLEDMRDKMWRVSSRYRRLKGAIDQSMDVFVRSVLEVTGSRVFVDANKDPIRIRFLTRLPGLRVRVIHLVRDPRGYANSVRRDFDRPAEAAADSWRRTNENVERHLLRLPRENWRRVNYESICADPGRTLQQLAEFLGVEPMTVPENFRGTPYHITGNKMAYDVSGSIRLDEKWRQDLPEESQRIVARRAGEMARRYGYDL